MNKSFEEILSEWDEQNLEFKILFANSLWKDLDNIIDLNCKKYVYSRYIENWKIYKIFKEVDKTSPFYIQMNNLLYHFVRDFITLRKTLEK